MAGLSTRHIEPLLPTGGASVTGAAALTATSSLTVAGTRTRTGAATLAATSSMTVAGTVLRVGAAALHASTTLVVNGSQSATGSSTLSATSSLVATAEQDVQTPQGGFVRVLPRTGPLLSTTRLKPAVAQVCVTVFQPQLSLDIQLVPTRTRAQAVTPLPTLIFDTTTLSHQRLGAYPRSRRAELDLILVALET